MEKGDGDGDSVKTYDTSSRHNKVVLPVNNFFRLYRMLSTELPLI
jgi:hypothetical protein